MNDYSSFENFKNSNGVNFNKWWNYPTNKKIKIDSDNYLNKFDILLKKAVKKQLISDAPLGAFLSGGTDSSLIVAIASEYVSNLQTFTVGFDFDNYDESLYAKKISDQILTELQ